MIRSLVLPFSLGVAIVLVTVGVYRLLEALLAGHSDYSRGLWEGVAVAWTLGGGGSIANHVLKRVARKEET